MKFENWGGIKLPFFLFKWPVNNLSCIKNGVGPHLGAIQSSMARKTEVFKNAQLGASRCYVQSTPVSIEYILAPISIGADPVRHRILLGANINVAPMLFNELVRRECRHIQCMYLLTNADNSLHNHKVPAKAMEAWC